MDVAVQSVLNGLSSGAIYGLIALGLSLQFGVMKIINFAHGSFLMITMYLTLWLHRYFGVHPLIAMMIVPVVMYAAGLLTQTTLLQGIYSKETAREPIGVLIFTTGLWIFLDNVFVIIAGPDYQTLASDYSSRSVIVGQYILSYPQIAALVVAPLVTSALVLFLKHTALGRAIRATGQDREAASVIGINSGRVYKVAFGLGLAALGVGGALLVPTYYVFPFVGDIFGLRAFVIVVLGGMGSIGGAFWAGLLVGLIESVGAQVMPVTFSETLIFAVFLAVLYFRPAGLFGLETE